MTGAREWLNAHPKIAAASGGVIVALAVILLVAQVLGSRHRYPSGPPQSFFTDDDGKTFFADSIDNVPPFDHKGQPAVMAYVFECGGTKFVGLMQRFTPKFHDFVVTHGPTPEALKYGTELKRPGDAKWLPGTDIQGAIKMADVHCPNGGADVPEAVVP